ncbi:MAG: hypothetical protein ACYDCK_12620 [Thermoplasmatota archaeon]
MLLENDPANACIGCGPANPMGLKLAFERTDEGATASFVAEARWQGFPGRMHSAVLYLALIETMNWSLYARTARMGLPTRTSALETSRRVDVGATVALSGRVLAVDESARTARVEAVAATPHGETIARLERDYALVDEATFLARMGYDAVPAGYEGVFE